MEFDIQSNWIRPSTASPSSGTRCIVTDGDVVLTATYISENSESCVWILTGLTENDSKTFSVEGWMPLPKPIKRLVKANENTEVTNNEEVKREISQ